VEVRVHVTEMLVRHLKSKAEFTVEAADLGALLDAAEARFRGFRDSVCDESGRIRVYVNVFVNGHVVGHDPEALSIALADGDEVYVLASVAGGRGCGI
jgi:sulfur-carrier protein